MAFLFPAREWYRLARDNIWSRENNVIYDLNPFEDRGIFFFSFCKFLSRKNGEKDALVVTNLA